MLIKRHHKENITQATNLEKVAVTSIMTKAKEPLKTNKTKKKKLGKTHEQVFHIKEI